MSRINARTATLFHAMLLKDELPRAQVSSPAGLSPVHHHTEEGLPICLPAQQGVDEGIAPEPIPKGNRVGSLFHFSHLETLGWLSCFVVGFQQPYTTSYLKVVRNPKESLHSHQQPPHRLAELAPRVERGLGTALHVTTPSPQWLPLPCP